MKLSVKVLIYSGLVFPGAGYFILEKTRRGVMAFATTISCLVFIMREIFHRANIVAEKIVHGDIAYDITVIREHILLTPGTLSEGTMNTLSIIIGAVWFISMLDSYYQARRQETRQE